MVALSGLLVKGGDEQEQAEQSDDAITLRHLDDRILETPVFLPFENANSGSCTHGATLQTKIWNVTFEAVMNYDKRKNRAGLPYGKSHQ